MLTRRHFLLGTTTAALLFAAGPRASAQGANEATAFVTKLGNDLVTIIDGPGSYEDKKRRLLPVVEAAVDVDGIARFCLGRYQRTATPDQTGRFTALFHNVLMNNIFGKIGEYQGVTFKPTVTTQRDAEILVGTIISRPNQQPNAVQWVVNNVGGRLRIIDVLAEGVSLRLTQRSDYAAYLQRNNSSVDALISAMQQQVAR